MNEVSPLDRIEAVLLRVIEVADRLARCAEAVSNPTYSVVERGKHGSTLLEIQSIRSTAGNIIITVKAANASSETMPTGRPLIGVSLTKDELDNLLDDANAKDVF